MFDMDVLHCTQPGAALIPFRIDVAAGTPSVVEGTRWLSVADTGAGIITVTLDPASARNMVVVAQATDTATGEKVSAHVLSVTESTFVLELIDEAGANVDNTDVSGIIVAFRLADEK